MVQQSQNNAPEYRAYAAAFQDKSVVEAYRYRPTYPAATFDVLTQLISTQPAAVLDVGCGSGDIARQLAPRVERVDAVDVSQPMLELGKQLPNGDHPHLHWLHGRIEDVRLQPPYALISAGESIHWMNWDIVMPLLSEVLVEGAYLAIIERKIEPVIWYLLGDVVSRYRTDTYAPQVNSHQEQSLFQKIGESITEPFTFAQSLDDVIASYHSRAGFSRERMGAVQAEAFDREAKVALLKSYPDGVVPFQVRAHIVWGFPLLLK
jgi:trans-aconitate methyltransferase